jgi:glycosyltransferase involved in cell wall biosynthesis
VTPERIEVVTLGVDRSMFQPLAQDEARIASASVRDATVLLYVGGLDRAHDLQPIIEAVTRAGNPTPVAPGRRRRLRAHLEQLAAGPARSGFTGRVPQQRGPYLHCGGGFVLAPYNPRHFPERELANATLKVREFLAAGRPVAIAPSGLLPDLICHGVKGTRWRTTVVTWIRFCKTHCPNATAARDGRRRRDDADGHLGRHRPRLLRPV